MGTKVIMVNDVARAFFEAPAMRNICIKIPKEDMSEADRRHDKVGHLRMSLYGTRDAAMNWQDEVAKEMRKWGFTRGQYNPCLYYHRQRNIRTFLHGDDFATVGTREGYSGSKPHLKAGSRSKLNASVLELWPESGRRWRVPLPDPPQRPPKERPCKRDPKGDCSTVCFG